MAAVRLGLPEPLSVAELVVTLVAAVVSAVGTEGVMKVSTEPQTVPAEFDAMAQ